MSKGVQNQLLYYIPNRSRPKTILRIPESHSLHICPPACGRRSAIRALQNGEKEFLSFLYMKEEDAVSGQYLENITAAVTELLAVLEPVPKAFVLYFNCIDDFLGTDEKALLRQLKSCFPGLYFTVCRINPVATDEKMSPGMRKHKEMYELLEYTGEKDDGLNLIGHYVSLDPESELFSLLAEWRIHKVRQLFACRTFAEYQEMAASRLNLVLMPMAGTAAREMQAKLDIPYYFNPASYDLQEVRQNYQNLAALLGRSCPDFRRELGETRLAIEEAREKVGNIPVVVDSSASMRPFALAKALWGYGFPVRAVFAPHSPRDDFEEGQWLAEHCPSVKLVYQEGVKAVAGYALDGLDGECLAIGYGCAFVLKARYFVDLFNDESFYGFQGIRKLMKLMGEAVAGSTDWEHKAGKSDKESEGKADKKIKGKSDEGPEGKADRKTDRESDEEPKGAGG